MPTVRSKDGTTIAYDFSGAGPVLIYITGAICYRNFFPIREDVKTFSQKFTIYNYDRRGRGESGDTKPYTIQKEVDDIEAIIEAAGGKAFLYGHSSGAALALEAAFRLGKKVSKLAIYDAPYVEKEEAKAEYDRLNTQVKTLLKDGKNKQALSTFLKGIGMPKFFIFLLPLMPGWKTMVRLAPTLLYDIELTKNLSPFKEIKKLQTPLCILVGEKSQSELQEVADQLSAAAPQATFIKVAKQDHMVSAKALLPIFTKFFSQT